MRVREATRAASRGRIVRDLLLRLSAASEDVVAICIRALSHPRFTLGHLLVPRTSGSGKAFVKIHVDKNIISCTSESHGYISAVADDGKHTTFVNLGGDQPECT